MWYRLKQEEIEAIQFTRENWDAVVAFTDGKARDISMESDCDKRFYCWIDAYNGNIKVYEGAYICKEPIFDYLYVRSQYLFESKYEPVVEEEEEPDVDPGEDNGGGEGDAGNESGGDNGDNTEDGGEEIIY